MCSTPGATATHCPYCALQCAMTLTLSGPGVASSSAAASVEVSGRDFPTNRGGLCRKGWSSAELLKHPDRVLEPLLKNDDGEHHPISWDRALELIRDRVLSTRARYGADAVGVFGGGGLTNEKAYLLGKFARLALGTSRIDYNGRFCMSSAAAAGNRAFGLDRGLPFPLTDLGSARTILMLGSNTADTMPPFVQHLRAARDAGGLIVVDPRRSATAELTSEGRGRHLQPAPKTDLALLLGITHVVIMEGLIDESYVRRRTNGYNSIVRSVAPWWPERVSSVTGVPARLIRETAHRLAEPGGTYILTGRGIEQHANGTDTATAAINLALLLGLPGTPGNGYGTLTGQGNGQGGREHGQKADQLPGYRKITDPAARKHIAGVWGVPESLIPGPGLPAVELLASLGQPGGVRCLFVHGANVAVSAPNASSVLKGLRSLDFLVVCDFFLSETAAEADLVLPVLQWAEEEGTMTNLEGRILRRRAAVSPPPGARSELWIMARLAELLEAPSSFPDDPETVFTELRAASAGGLADYSGVDYAMLDAELHLVELHRGELHSRELHDGGAGAYWPYPAGSSGTPRLFVDRFAHTDGRAVLHPVAPSSSAHFASAPDGVLTLMTGRLLEHYQSGAQTRRVVDLHSTSSEQALQIHPVTAGGLGILDGAEVEVSNERGTVRAAARLSPAVRPDTVFLSFHFPGTGNANVLTSSETDPVSGMPEFKTTQVLVRVHRPAQSEVVGV
ncbi:nitrite reductase [Arthrobacter sp. Soil782]|uniref:molybdopterin oxidoreductase family protein n=1 Tax=Arthrobacter sp. Soil782 TaxID=1736410 RepID=UPI0006F9E1E8|nr:molybdopterin oxidoreductase family protein [Arthrobacter sp. Soil782]KRF05052.1 nitrite reductase [Arthrobacter sp. Soil782]